MQSQPSRSLPIETPLLSSSEQELAQAPARVRPLRWVPTAYVAEGIPFALVIWAAGTMFKQLGHSDGDITLALGPIAIAWSLKPLWAAFLDMFKTKKFFVLSMELVMAGLCVAMAGALSSPRYFGLIVALLWVMAFASATQDICVDGVYITALDRKQQAAWIGVQGMCWNTGRIFATAVLVYVAAHLVGGGTDPKAAWAIALLISAATLAGLGVYHAFVLPSGALSERPASVKQVVSTFSDSVVDFFRKKSIWGMLLFVFLYRSGEGFLLVEAPLFMQAPISEGGLGLALEDKAAIDGVVSTIVSIVGGLAGGVFVSRYGLRKVLVVLALAMNIPHLCFVFLSQAASPTAAVSLPVIMTLVSIEKLGYSFGFVGNMLYMMQQIAPGKFKMTHYAFATALMNLVLVPTQALSGPLADALGYRSFFIFVMLASIPSVIAAWFAPFPNAPEAEPALRSTGH